MIQEYGYCRVSTNKQSIERQIRNIKELYPDAYIVQEVFTGTKFEGRREWNKLYNSIKKDITNGKQVRLIFDSVSRMSRNAEEGSLLYEKLYNQGIELVFLKETYVNSEIYKKALNVDIQLIGGKEDILLNAIKQYLIELAKEQIKLAFLQSEKEVMDLRKRTSEGLKTAKLNGKQIGRISGRKYVTIKEQESKALIIKNSKDFLGSNSDEELMRICGISKNTYYKYKRELKNQNLL